MTDESKTEGQETTDLKGSDETSGKVFTQDDVNRIVQKRVGDDSEKITRSILGELGVDSLDDVKNIIQAQKEADEASKTELQKLQEQIESKDKAYSELEQRFTAKSIDTEVQDIIIEHGIDPKKSKYVKIDYLEAKKGEGFELDTFVSGLKESQPDFFTTAEPVVNNIGNPPSRTNPAHQIKMSDYAVLSAEERKKYKSTDIIR